MGHGAEFQNKIFKYLTFEEFEGSWVSMGVNGLTLGAIGVRVPIDECDVDGG